MDIQAFRAQYPQYNDMSDDALADSLYNKHYSDLPREQFESVFRPPPAPEPSAPGFTPEQTGAFTAAFGPPPEKGTGNLGGWALEHAPEIGAMAPGLAAVPFAMAGQGLKDIFKPPDFKLPQLGQYSDVPVQNPMNGFAEQPFPVSIQDLQSSPAVLEGQRLLGAGAMGEAANLMGGLAGKVADKLLAPAAGKITEAGRNFMNWASEKNLPYSVDTVGGFTNKLVQGLADTGLGRFFTNRQRGQLVQGATDAAGDILNELGLPVSRGIVEEGLNLKNVFKESANKEKIYAGVNEALSSIPKDQPVAASALPKILAEAGNLDKIAQLYGGTNSRQYIAAKRIANAGDTIPMGDLDWFSKNIWSQKKGWYSDLLPEEKGFLGSLKAASLEDMEMIAVPQMSQTVGALRKAADQSYKEAMAFLNETPLAKQLAGSTELNIQRNFFKLYSEPYAKDAVAIRQFLDQTGKTDVKNAIDSAYLESVFTNATKQAEETGERIFQPGKYIDWYSKYGEKAAKIMPEYAENLSLWNDISKGLMRDYSRLGGKSLGVDAAIGTLGAAGIAGLGHMGPAIIVPTGFSLLAALGTMGKGNLGFLRNYLLNESIGPAGMMIKGGAKGAAQFGTAATME